MHFEDDSEEKNVTFVKIKTNPHRRVERKPTRKTSYESNADVQRWLREHGPEDVFKPPFNPTFLASLRDGPWIISSLAQFYEQDLITDVLHVIKSGKEATVYCCTAHPSTGAEYLAAKVYRPRMFRSLRNDAIYRQSRVQRDLQGRAVRGKHSHVNASSKSQRGRAMQVSTWIEYEYQTQCLLYSKGAHVPQPFAQTGNAVLMEYIGDVGEPAPLLREVTLTQKEAQPLFERIMGDIELSLACDRIHGDLSEYNILYWRDSVTIIDFAQAVDPRYNPGVFALLLRDIERVCSYFALFGVRADPYDLATELWERYIGITELM